ncbi:MAG: ferrous iron transport protein A [Clostridiales bacterium]|nr:ferrous iron transport protein A [Clostridiales bacterium]
MEELCGIPNLAPLDTVPVGVRAKVKMLVSDGSVRRRLLDLGLILDTDVEALLKSPSGDPTAYRFRGAVIALRSEVANKIMVEIGSR